MKDANENEAQDEPGRAATTPEALNFSPQKRSAAPFIAAAVVILLIAGIALALFLRSRNNIAGRPVPAPSNTTLNQAGAYGPAITGNEMTITLAPAVAQRAGLKIETVGEQPLSDAGANGAVATGVIQANAYRTTPVASLVGGIVRRVNVELGQEVKRGQIIAVVFSEELAIAQSRYLTALAQLEEHHKHHRREAQLVEIGAASREEFEQATTQLRTAESEVAVQRQKLLLLGLTPQRIDQLNTSSQISSEVSLPAPASGTVVSRTANPGEVIPANKDIARVADLSSVWMIGQVYEKDLARVRVGSGASITTEAYPGRVFRGRIAYVDPSIDQATRTAQVRIELANPGQALKLGMYVNVSIAALAGATPRTPVVPRDAVQNVNNQQVVFVCTKDANTFVLRPVRVGPESNSRYPVLEGLSVGERIVTEGTFLLRAEWIKTNSGTH